jgi:hypothetical protein
MHFYMHSYLHKIFILVKSGCYSIHLAKEVKTFFGNSTTTMGPSIESNTQKPELPTDSHHRHRQKREGEICTPKSYKAKHERLCSA